MENGGAIYPLGVLVTLNVPCHLPIGTLFLFNQADTMSSTSIKSRMAGFNSSVSDTGMYLTT